MIKTNQEFYNLTDIIYDDFNRNFQRFKSLNRERESINFILYKSINEINIINIYLSNYVKYYKNDSAAIGPSIIDWMLRNTLREDVWVALLLS